VEPWKWRYPTAFEFPESLNVGPIKLPSPTKISRIVMSSFRDPTLIFKKAIPPKAPWTDDELKIHLQQSVTLELTTIPLYLYAMFSLNVNPGADPKTDPTAKAAANILRE
jgi:hypothetical protein